MGHCVSTFKSSRFVQNVIDKNATAVMSDVSARTSIFPSVTFQDDCEEYAGFLDEMQVLMDKVSSGDLSDFEEF